MSNGKKEFSERRGWDDLPGWHKRNLPTKEQLAEIKRRDMDIRKNLFEEEFPEICIVIDSNLQPHPDPMGNIYRGQKVTFHSPCQNVELIFTKYIFDFQLFFKIEGSRTLTVMDNPETGPFTYKIKRPGSDTGGSGQGGGEVG